MHADRHRTATELRRASRPGHTALGFGTRQAANAHDGRDMAFEDPAPFARCRRDPAQFGDDSFLVIAESGERFGRRLVVGFQVKIAKGKHYADAVRRGERKDFLAGHGSSPNARRAAISCCASHAP